MQPYAADNNRGFGFAFTPAQKRERLMSIVFNLNTIVQLGRAQALELQAAGELDPQQTVQVALNEAVAAVVSELGVYVSNLSEDAAYSYNMLLEYIENAQLTVAAGSSLDQAHTLVAAYLRSYDQAFPGRTA